MVSMGTPQDFLNKNMKWFALAFLVLFLFKSVQSCTRNMTTTVSEKDYKYTIDSLVKKDKESASIIMKLESELMLQSFKASEADKRASVIQSVAEKIKSNTTTTVNVRGADIDTTNKSKP
jgi:hypothetical protein